MSASWGILGPGSVESVRRVRTLGLASSTRLFNELAVPGLGGVWFGKQLLFSTLGVMVAELEHRGGVWDRLAAQIYAHEAAQAGTVV